MHASFPEETRLLQTAFSTMGGISGAYVLGDALRGLQWHVFVAQSAAAQQQPVSSVGSSTRIHIVVVPIYVMCA
jgi:hypothetical protein